MKSRFSVKSFLVIQVSRPFHVKCDGFYFLHFFPGLEELCNDTIDDSDDEDVEELKAVVPEGIICTVSRAKPDVVIWKQNFKSPIVHAWKLVKGQLVPIDLFSNSHLPR